MGRIKSSIQEKEMEDHGISLNKFCPCIQTQCRIRGNCVVCVQNHLDHKRHIPECFQDMLRDQIQVLAKMTELKTEEARPNPSFWEKFDRDKRLRESVARHTGKDDGSNKASPAIAAKRGSA
jgi:hypothetical protein